jgi:hypothetical protein
VKITRNDQYGFKRGYSTTHVVLSNVERITHSFRNNKATIAFFLDIERAFDKVWTRRLMAKFITAKVPHHFIYIIHSYLEIRSFSVMHKNSYSSPRPIQSGVPQGCLLGSKFNIYINDISSVENDSNVAISVYSDDMNISVRSGSIDIAVRKNVATSRLHP